MSEISQLEPQGLWKNFASLNAVPRASKKEQQVIQFAKEFGESLGLETLVDEIGNVIIRKPATTGMEDRIPVVLQSHLDMVHQKNNDTDFDFATQGIRMQVEGDWVSAEGTTLGADNGIGVAAIMAILQSSDIPHPPLEALFTIDEETGMTGAKGLKGGLLHGGILLNLDTEDDDELTIGCAGGVDVTAKGNYEGEETPHGYHGFRLTVKGLKGGHSGMDIHRGRANANKLMNRLLWRSSHHFGLRVSTIDGGGLRNAIPRESVAQVAVPENQVDAWNQWLEKESQSLVTEYQSTDPDLTVIVDSETVESLLPESLQFPLLGAIYGCVSGVYRLSPDIPDLVETSNNLARVLVKDGDFTIACLTRSSVDAQRDDLASSLSAVFQLTGASIETSGDYPGWPPAPSSSIVTLMSKLYQELFSAEAHVAACHAGLECGILGTNYPDMEMISFGPNIRGAHSPEECVQISSVQKFWGYLLETLKRIPVAN